jgi:DNA primase
MHHTYRQCHGQHRLDLGAIKDRVDLNVIAPHFGVVRKGRGWVCPFHDDHDPSLGLRGPTFRCFACGARGDCFEFAARLLSCEFREAVEAVCEASGLVSPFGSRRPRRSKPRGDRRPGPEVRIETAPLPGQAVEVLTWFADVVRIASDAADDNPALEYLRGRGISRRTALAHGLGYVADYRRVGSALRGRFSLADLQAAGVFNAAGNLRFYRHRLILPFSSQGQVYGLQARNILWRAKEDGPKELLAARPGVPFNANALAGRPARVFLAEGVIDCLSLLGAGLVAVGIPGAHGFKAAWVPLFDAVDEVVVAFDRDPAGKDGTRAVADAFAAAGRRDVKAVHWPEGIKDANEFTTRVLGA